MTRTYSPPLPAKWVEKIFEKLGLLYGREFLNRWQGLDIAAVQADWAVELAGFYDNPEAIAYALENLPLDRPPTVRQFREIARRAPPKPLPRLPHAQASPERVQAELAKIRAMFGRRLPPPAIG